MTNLEAYMVYGLSESEGTLSLSRYSVDPVGTDTNQVASAIGMIDKAMMSDYSDGTHVQRFCHQIDGHHQQRTLEQLAGAGAVDNAQQLVNQEGNDDDIQQIDQFEGLEICNDRVQSHWYTLPFTVFRSGQQRGRQCPAPHR